MAAPGQLLSSSRVVFAERLNCTMKTCALPHRCISFSTSTSIGRTFCTTGAMKPSFLQPASLMQGCRLNIRRKFLCSLSHDQLNSDVESIDLDEDGIIESAGFPSIPLNNGVSVDDLMKIVKDAEKNVLVLSQIRSKTIAELNEARSSNDALQGQVKVLNAKLAEAEAKLQLASKTKEINQQLYSQIENLERRTEIVDQLEKDSVKLREEIAATALQLSEMEKKSNDVESLHKSVLEKEAKKLLGVGKRADELQREKTRLEQEINRLSASAQRAQVLQQEKTRMDQDMSALQQRLVESEQAARDKSRLDKEVQRLQANLKAVEVVQQEKGRLEQEVRKLRAVSEQLEKDKATEKEKLEKQVRNLQARLAELEKMKRTKNKSEVEAGQLKGALSKVQSLEGEKGNLQEQISKLQEDMTQLRQRNGELEQAAALTEKSSGSQVRDLEESVNKLRNSLLDEKNKTEVAAAKAMSSIQELNREKEELQASLSAALKAEEELSFMTERCASLLAEVAAMKEIVDQSRPLKQAAEEIRRKNVSLKESVKKLEEAASATAEERRAWQEGEIERMQLKEKVVTLTEQLAESDSLMQRQVDNFRTEIEVFQGRLESLAAEGNSSGYQVPAGEMPWEFWSDLLLCLDGLLLVKRLSTEESTELRLMAWQRNSRIRDAYVSLQGMAEKVIADGLRALLAAKRKPGMHIVHIAAEMAPVAKVGGLADVVTGLGRALQKKGHLVEVILPKYDCMDYSRIQDLKVLDFSLSSYFDGKQFENKVWRGIVEGLPVYFIEPLHPDKLFWRNAFYGENDDFRRFTYFCRAALEFLVAAGKKPDILHCHDWQTALVAPLHWEVFAPSSTQKGPPSQVVFTCHNFEYQGADSPQALAASGLDVAAVFRQDRMQDSFATDRINLLKGGFVYSNLITTVSPTYALEVRGPEGGKGLHVTLASCAHKFFGVLNGIDYDAWDPRQDPLLPFNYDAASADVKFANKAALRTSLGLGACSDGDKPLVGCVTRLVPQKGVHLIRHAIYRTRDMGGQFVLLGSSPVPEIQRDFESIAAEFAGHADIRLVLKYDEALSHSIFAACDIFIIPSIFEPCGLTQLIAMRYGAIPVVRKTGGLADSVFDVDDGSIPESRKNGFTFTATDESGLNYALDRALGYYYNHPDWWQELVVRAMKMDFSWEESSEKYVQLYEKTIQAALD